MLAIMTDDVRFFYDCATLLREKGVPFLAIPVDGEIPSTVTLVLTTRGEAPGIDFLAVVADDDAGRGVKSAMARMNGGERFVQVICAFDPGPRPGFAVFGDGALLEAGVLDSVKDCKSAVEAVLAYADAEGYLIRIGHQDVTNRNRMINLLWPLGITVEVVREDKTTPRSHTPNADAAVAIGRKQGESLHWPPAVKPTSGELREVQRQSRISSSGEATISRELARAVARGELSMVEALERTTRRKKDDDEDEDVGLM